MQFQSDLHKIQSIIDNGKVQSIQEFKLIQEKGILYNAPVYSAPPLIFA